LLEKLMLKNLTSNEEINCVVIDINPGNSAVPKVGVEFSEPYPRFWKVSFPPPDRNPRGQEVKRVSSVITSPKPSPVEE
jgi:hypothetical protein